MPGPGCFLYDVALAALQSSDRLSVEEGEEMTTSQAGLDQCQDQISRTRASVVRLFPVVTCTDRAMVWIVNR